MLAVGIIGGVVGGYLAYRNNQKKFNAIIELLDKEIAKGR